LKQPFSKKPKNAPPVLVSSPRKGAERRTGKSPLFHGPLFSMSLLMKVMQACGKEAALSGSRIAENVQGGEMAANYSQHSLNTGSCRSLLSPTVERGMKNPTVLAAHRL
jgi:hypothetical protein